MIERIFHAHPDGGEGLLGVLVRASDPLAAGCVFLTDPPAPMQLATMRHPAGHRVEAHWHPTQPGRVAAQTHEVLFVRSGRVEVTFYAFTRDFERSVELVAGDVLLICGGIHAVSTLDDAEVIECKGGPYNGKALDKEPFIVGG